MTIQMQPAGVDAAVLEQSRFAADPPDCLVCGNRRCAAAFPWRFPWLMRCSHCRLLFVSPQPSDAELAEIYGPDYYTTFGYDPQFQAAYWEMKQASAVRVLEMVERHQAPGRLLDVGSGLGDLLLAADRRGWEVHGIEINPYAVQAADELLPGHTFLGSLEEFTMADGPFDFVTCLDVIEHLRRPDVSLRRMFDYLRPEGGLVVTTPDVGSWQAKLFGPRWHHFHRDHLWYFSRATLTALVQAAGFEVLACRPAWKTFNLRYILGILAENANFPLAQSIAQAGLRRLPVRLLTMLLPAFPEGRSVLARRPLNSKGERGTFQKTRPFAGG